MPLHAVFLLPNEVPCLQDWILQLTVYIAISAEMQRPRGGHSRKHRVNAAKKMQMTACRNRTAGNERAGMEISNRAHMIQTEYFSHTQYCFHLGITSKTMTGSQQCLRWMPKRKSCKYLRKRQLYLPSLTQQFPQYFHLIVPLQILQVTDGFRRSMGSFIKHGILK